LAEFHGKQASIIFSSAYAAVCGTISSLITKDTAVLSDALNHNCIINAVRLSKPSEKLIYEHLDMDDLDRKIESIKGRCRRVLAVTDGVFSMRGDYPDLKRLVAVVDKYNAAILIMAF
jgi:glycine C-acetyltransferase